MRFNYHQHIVRDLAWAIASPPLMLPQGLKCLWYDDAWYRDLYNSSQSWFDEQDAMPEVLQEKLNSQKDRRLGRYFETLWAFWIERSPRFELLEQNLALREGGKTLGELDFLVLDKESGHCLHWEVAVKFYLGVGELSRHSCWYGPGKKDRLDLKVKHLRDRQSVIAHRQQTQQMLVEKGYEVDACGVILKGCLFYPQMDSSRVVSPEDANPTHLRSYWLTLSDLNRQAGVDERFSPLLGYGWMAQVEPEADTPWMNLDELHQALNSGDYRLPLHLLQDNGNVQYKRFFVVSDDWEKNIGQLSE